ncbi:MAG: type III-B CRISPR module-associated protein Cmr5 [Bacteroidetes bacterium]|nr:type III-B CRISPR module-associated protein Cmr5 [Bacteroidota bacterium]
MTQQTNLKGIENGRAEFAYQCAEQGKDKGKDYKSYVKKIPMMIKTNGIGSTFAFMFSKNGKKEGIVYLEIGRHVFEWLKKDVNKSFKLENINSFQDLVKNIVKLNSTEYRALTIEVLAFLNWLRRFADGLIEGEE